MAIDDGPTQLLYGQQRIQDNQLEALPNPTANRPYLISHECPEFTCLCPRSGFPDFATIRIQYVPAGHIIELKSLKLYINGFRDRHLFHEAAVNTILDDLVTAAAPAWMEVVGDFAVRGNIKTEVAARHGVRPKGA
ncbi:MAG: 7-cyano-7-deazaguanine reductase [Chloroflexota bacterium]|jgi:7-cyano-7-deazaguanine reductase|nr:7-cyano-7-deazaguanine reductase [Chloroflexota bacterium]